MPLEGGNCKERGKIIFSPSCEQTCMRKALRQSLLGNEMLYRPVLRNIPRSSRTAGMNQWTAIKDNFNADGIASKLPPVQ